MYFIAKCFINSPIPLIDSPIHLRCWKILKSLFTGKLTSPKPIVLWNYNSWQDLHTCICLSIRSRWIKAGSTDQKDVVWVTLSDQISLFSYRVQHLLGISEWDPLLSESFSVISRHSAQKTLLHCNLSCPTHVLQLGVSSFVLHSFWRSCRRPSLSSSWHREQPSWCKHPALRHY